MTAPTQTLPDGYVRTDEVNLAKNKGLAVLLNFIGFAISVLTFILLAWLLRSVRQDAYIVAFKIQLDRGIVGQLLVLVVFITLSLILHELIHGFFFWLFTRSQPVYALHLAYAYAAAPAWYIPVRQYWIIGIAPLVLIDAAGLLLILFAPASWILLLIFLVAFNTGGAVGDMLITLRLLRTSSACLVNDVGDGVTFFEPVLSHFSSPMGGSVIK
jgi:hypothetical protein